MKKMTDVSVATIMQRMMVAMERRHRREAEEARLLLQCVVEEVGSEGVLVRWAVANGVCIFL